ncbi:MAG: M20/M25/M40 family metallo-hydrolase [Myxococcales bacterium]|nr:M20/M25/M40 family metallo-hydrolase [Myxococcales bacterium]
MRTLAALALALAAACAAEGADGPDGGGADDDGGAPDADPCQAPTAAPAWLDAYLTSTIAKLTGAAELAPGVRLTDRATATRRAATRTFLTAELTGLGLAASLDDYGQGANVVGELPATSGAGAALVIVGAHLDTVAGSPGADDNASGVATTLAVARMLRDVACRDRRIQFVLFDQEEIGLIGSTYLANRLRQTGADVTAVHTLDQLGWDGDGDRRFEIELPTPTLWAQYQAAATTLGVGVDETATGSTDHQAFRERGFPAVGVSEEFASGDTTPYYHAATDTAATLTIPYVALGARLVALVVAREVGAP